MTQPVHNITMKDGIALPNSYNALNAEKINNRWSVIWKVAEVASLVAFAALAITAVIFSTFYAPLTFLVTISIVYPGLPLYLKLGDFIADKAKYYASEAAFASNVLERMNLIADGDVEKRCKELGIENCKWNKKEAKLLLAQYDWLEEMKKPLLKELSLKKQGNNPKYFLRRMLTDYVFQEKVGKILLNQGYIIRILSNKDDIWPQWHHVWPPARENVQRIDDVEFARNLLKKPYTLSDILKRDPKQLAHEFYEVPKKSFFSFS